MKEGDWFTIGLSDGRFFGKAKIVPQEVQSPGWIHVAYERTWREGSKLLDRKGTIWVNLAHVATVSVFVDEEEKDANEENHAETHAFLRREYDRLTAEFQELRAKVQDESREPEEREALREQAIQVGMQAKQLEKRLAEID